MGNRKKGTESDLRKFFENPAVEKCPYCGISYDDFRTGETFDTVLASLWVDSPDNRDWNNKGRHTVLGRWHEIKQNMWSYHLEMEEKASKIDLESVPDYYFDDFSIGEY